MKIVTLEQLPSELPDLGENPRVVGSGNFAAPVPVLEKLNEILPTWRYHCLNAMWAPEPREGLSLETSFVGPAMRKRDDVSYVPCRLSLLPTLYAQKSIPDVVVVNTSLPRKGRVSLGVEVNVLPAAIESARENGKIVIAMLNPSMPWLNGDAVIPTDDIDFGIEVDVPLVAADPKAPDDMSMAIGEAVAHRIPDGSTLQLGIGGVPDAVLSRLTEQRDLGIWTEMISDGVLALDKAGALDNHRDIITSFMFGSNELYEWVDDNPRVIMRRTEVTNSPAEISKHPYMFSINTALEIDLLAQANASRIETKIFSGFGGQPDFVVGGLHSPGGQSIMALKSWHPKANVSTIVPRLARPVTSLQPTAVITENGVAEIFGWPQKQQVHDMINNAAHPDAREELTAAATEFGWL